MTLCSGSKKKTDHVLGVHFHDRVDAAGLRMRCQGLVIVVPVNDSGPWVAPTWAILLWSGQCYSCPQPTASKNTLLAARLPGLVLSSRNLVVVRHAIGRRLYPEASYD